LNPAIPVVGGTGTGLPAVSRASWAKMTAEAEQLGEQNAHMLERSRLSCTHGKRVDEAQDAEQRAAVLSDVDGGALDACPSGLQCVPEFLRPSAKTEIPLPRLLLCLVLIALVLAPSPATAQVFRVEQMTTAQIAALDRQKTAVLLWGGILEEHGPYLPVFTDGYMNEYLALLLSRLARTRPKASAVCGTSPDPTPYGPTPCRLCSWTSPAQLASRDSAGYFSCTATPHLPMCVGSIRRRIISIATTRGAWCI
jgi:hypothetical protein